LYFCRADLSVARAHHRWRLKLREWTRRCRDSPGFDNLSGRARLRARQIVPHWFGRFSGRPGELLDRPSGATGLYVDVCHGFLPARVHDRMDRERLTQIDRVGGLIKVSSNGSTFRPTAPFIGILSISYLVGDAAARQWMGLLIHRGVGWRPLFYLAAGAAVSCSSSISCYCVSRASMPAMTRRKTNPLTCRRLRGGAGGLRDLLMPLLRSRAFCSSASLSLGCTIIREHSIPGHGVFARLLGATPPATPPA